MKTRLLISNTLVAGAFVGLAQTTIAQEMVMLPKEILACAEESDVMMRLSCYDREVAALRNRPISSPAPAAAPNPPSAVQETMAPPAAAPAAPVATVAASAPTTDTAAPTRTANSIDNFGFDSPEDEVTSGVARIRERPYGELIIYLDNGQIWEQKHLDRRFRLKAGETVTISKSSVAGYRLSGSSNRSIQVERLK